MPIRFVRYIIIAILIQVLSTATYASKELGPKKTLFTVDRIEIHGNKKVENEAILEKLSAKAGQKVTNYMIHKDIQSIYALKFFENVEVHHEKKSKKNILIFKVKEKPIISRILVFGNDEVSSEDLLEHTKTKEFSIVDVNTIKSDVKIMEALYEEKGFFLAGVSYRLIPGENGSQQLIFDVKEHDKVKVKKVIFLGNSAFTDDELKSVITTKEEHLFSFMDGSGSFKELHFQADLETLKYFYRNKGYLQVNIGTPEVTISEDKKWVFVTIKLNEGPQFSINEIAYQGEVLFTEEELNEKTTLKTGDIYSEEKLRKDIQKLTESYQDKGYAFANVLRFIRMVPGENKVNVEFSFEKGKLAHFGKITIKGNTKTRDKVIRRELKISEGEKFSGTFLRESKENVNRLGFFEPGSVVFNTVSPPGKDDVLDVEITVKERNTGQISFGAGYSTSTKFFVQGSLAQTNFMGKGQNLSFSVSWADTDQTYNIGFTEPYFNDTKWSTGGDVFKTNNSQSSSYSYERQGFNLRVGYPIFEYTRLFLTYKFEDTLLENVEDKTIDESLENGVASSVRATLKRDKRNNSFEPTDGHLLSFSSEYAGLGGDKEWTKLSFEARYYKKVVGDLVFRSRLFTGKLFESGRKIPQTEKYTLGGSKNLRGFDYEDIGPKRVVFDSDLNKDVTYNSGGFHTLYGSIELEHPLAREAGLKWVVFLDAGNVYEKAFGNDDDYSLHADVGVGFRWFSPIGVLRFEFGKPLTTVDDGNDGVKFNFDIGPYF